MMPVSEETIRSLGLTLLDSLWQGAALLFVCGSLLWLLRNRSSRVRYYVVLAGLLALPVMTVVTFTGHYHTPAEESAMNSHELVLPVQPSVAGDEGLPVPDLTLVDQWHNWAQSNASYISLIWVIGFALFAFRLSGGFYMVHKLKRNSKTPMDDYWVNKIRSMCMELGIKLPVELRQSASLTSPIVMGYLKPIVIFPIGLLQGLPTDQVEAILLHELAHIKRYDYLINVFVSLLQVVFFYHPAYWWLQSQLDSEREYSCDDLVLNQTGNRLSLVKALAAVREFQITGQSPALGFAGHKNQLLKRVERIMKKKTRTNWLGGLISMSVLLLSFFLMSYQSKDGNQQKSETAKPAFDSIGATNAHFDPLANPSQADSAGFTAIELVLRSFAQTDTLTLEQAILELMDTKASGIMLETDGKGNLLTLKKNGKEVSGDDFKVYKKAHTRLKEYVRNESALSQSLRELEKRLNEREQSLDELKSRERALEQELVEYELHQNRLKTIELYEKSLKERQDQIAEQRDRQISQSKLVEELKTKEQEYSEQRKVLEMYTVFMAELKALEQKRDEIEAKRRREVLKQYEFLYNEIRNRNSPVKSEFTEEPAGQLKAAEQIARYSISDEKPLIVVDNKMYKDWSYADLDKIDKNRNIISVSVLRSGFPLGYGTAMKGRDVLLLVTTKPAEKGYERPEIQSVVDRVTRISDLERKEVFSKRFINSLMAEDLLQDGWKNIQLSRESLLIDNEKQSKKTLKKYLKMYEEVMGKPLDKGQTIEFED